MANDPTNGQQNEPQKRRTVSIGFSWLYLILIAGIAFMLFNNSGSNPQKV